MTGCWSDNVSTERTLIVFSGDNGGWMSANGTAGGNNYPLAGGKYSTCGNSDYLLLILLVSPVSCLAQLFTPIRTAIVVDFLPDNWEGGIRMNSFISGGFIPVKQRGTVYHGLVAAWDW